MKVHINWRTVLGYGFILIAIALVSLASSLVFHPEEIITARFWIVVGLKTVVSVLTFNIIYFNMMITKKADQKSSLGLTFADYAKYVTAVYDGKQYDAVQKAIHDGNQTRFKETATSLLQKITVALDYEAITKANDGGVLRTFVTQIIEKFQLTKREARRLRKSVKKVINGRVKFTRLDYNEIMLNADGESARYPRMSINEPASLAVRNINIVINSAIMSALFTIFALNDFNTGIIYEIVSNAVTIAFAIFNANVFSVQQATRLKNAYQARKDFLCKIVDLPIQKQPS